MPISLTATEYIFQGEGITASYYPGGAGGPLVQGEPEMFFAYQDHHQSKNFGQEDVDIQQVDNVGAFVSVRLVESHLDGGPVTTFTVIVPEIGVQEGSPQTFKTKSITTIQGATYVKRQVFPALQTYKVDHLDGTASVLAGLPRLRISSPEDSADNKILIDTGPQPLRSFFVVPDRAYFPRRIAGVPANTLGGSYA